MPSDSPQDVLCRYQKRWEVTLINILYMANRVISHTGITSHRSEPKIARSDVLREMLLTLATCEPQKPRHHKALDLVT